MSDGCSGDPILSADPKARKCCVEHDRKYFLGGSRADREAADTEFRACLVKAGVPMWRAWYLWLSVRTFGGPSGRQPGVSWAFGDAIFRYTEKP
jgi:hypothetical protein